MTHLLYPLGRIKVEYAVLEITEHNHVNADNPDTPVRSFEIEFNGYSLLHVAEAYRELGKWLDTQYEIEAGEAMA